MDESNQNPNPQAECPGVASRTPPKADQNTPDPEDAGSGPETGTSVPEFASEVPAAVAPVVTNSTSSSIERYWGVALVAILALAVALRTRGINWDEGQHLHPDERFVTMVAAAIDLPDSFAQYFDTAQSPLSPYNNNFSSFVYGTAPLFFVRSIGELVRQTDYGEIVLLGRTLSALADLFVVVMTFAIGKRLYGLRIGLLAALFYATAVLPIQQSHFFTVDTFTNAPLMLAFWFALDVAEGKRGWRSFALAGACFGLMLASRINTAPFIGIIALAGLLRLIQLPGRVRLNTGELHERSIHKDAEKAKLAASDSLEVSEALRLRTLRFGPLLVEIEVKPEIPAGPSPDAREPKRIKSGAHIWQSVQPTVVGLTTAAIAALIVFRIAQPYAFEGFFTLNPQFLDDMARAQRLVSGQDDYPPGHQWTNRTLYWFPWYNMVFWGLGPLLGLAAWLGVGVAAVQVLRNQKREHVLTLFWVIGMFLFQGQQFVMTMRYMLPLYPFLTIFAAFFLFAVWERTAALAQNTRAARFTAGARVTAGALFAVVVVATLFWAIAFASIYTRTNTRVAASRWIYSNVADTEVVGNEHWDDSLPLRVDGNDYFRDHQGVMLELYGEDTPEKRQKMIGWVDQVDYIILSSNRLYGSIPRLPMRYPLTTQYYKWLFDGQLGFARVKEFTSYPQFLNIAIADDKAEEAFTVYDHPKVIIFRKTPAYSHDHVVKLFNSVDLTEVLRLKPLDATASRRQFRMTPGDLAANRAGGTWSSLFNPHDLANRLPLLTWLAMVWLIGVLTFPFTFIAFRAFADRGYAFAKALGTLFVAWFAWTLSSYHILAFGRPPILLGLIVMLGCGLVIVRSKRREMTAWIRTNYRLFLIEELVFFAFFAVAFTIRYHNPDLWHPSFGGEKPMDFAYLNAIVKTTFFPPYNPWFAGNYINYYYFGQLMGAALVRLSGITPEVAYNLLLPLFFAFTAGGAYGIVFNLVSSGRRRVERESQLPGDGPSRSGTLPPIIAGVFAVILILLMGNLGEVRLAVNGLTDMGGDSGIVGLIKGLANWLSGEKAIPVRTGDWYWTATRVIPNTINEFPFFTFLYGDLHAHLIAIPYTLVVLGVAVHVLLNRGRPHWYDVGLIALVLGALRAVNTWDYPTYLGIIGATWVLRLSTEWKGRDDTVPFHRHEWLQHWLRSITLVLLQVALVLVPASILGVRLNLEIAIYLILLSFGVAVGLSQAGKFWNPYLLVREFGWQLLAVITLSVLFFLPYVLDYATGYASAELWTGVRTTFGEYVTVHGIFLFIVATLLLVITLTNRAKENAPRRAEFEFTGWVVYLLTLSIVTDAILLVFKLYVLALVFPLISLGVWLNFNRETLPEARWVVMLMTVSLVLTLLVEVVVLKGDVGRMNTVFKFYLQVWVMLGLACAAGLALMIEYLAFSRPAELASAGATAVSEGGTVFRRAPGNLSGSTSLIVRRAWWGSFTILILAGLLYPLAATPAKMHDRYVGQVPPGLNGMDYMQRATYSENNQELVLRWYYDAIQWMRANIKGSPVIMEANTGLYRWGNRYSIYTGLPTVIGWDWHTKQQYSLLSGDLIDRRVASVREFYNTPDQARAMEIARRYEVSYVVIGGLERAVYDESGLDKFGAMEQKGVLRKVYDVNKVQIYLVLPAKAAISNEFVDKRGEGE